MCEQPAEQRLGEGPFRDREGQGCVPRAAKSCGCFLVRLVEGEGGEGHGGSSSLEPVLCSLGRVWLLHYNVHGTLTCFNTAVHPAPSTCALLAQSRRPLGIIVINEIN